MLTFAATSAVQFIFISFAVWVGQLFSLLLCCAVADDAGDHALHEFMFHREVGLSFFSNRHSLNLTFAKNRIRLTSYP